LQTKGLTELIAPWTHKQEYSRVDPAGTGGETRLGIVLHGLVAVVQDLGLIPLMKVPVAQTHTFPVESTTVLFSHY